MKTTTANIPIIDYEGSQYRTDFWENQGREYEDAVERVALRQLIPAYGQRLVEVGAGFGRLADMYLGYEQIVLFDYSRTLLQDAAKRWGHDSRFVFVAGNIYHLPLATRLFDTLVLVRVMHHLADVQSGLEQLHRILHGKSIAVLEYANKRNVKAILRWALNRQSWSPFAHKPHEFVELNFDFHPNWMEQQLLQCGFNRKKRLSVSHFRMPALKRILSPKLLVNLDESLFHIGGRYPVSPSVFVQVSPTNTGVEARSVDLHNIAALFRCPSCESEAFTRNGHERIVCTECGSRYSCKQGVWDLKEADT